MIRETSTFNLQKNSAHFCFSYSENMNEDSLQEIENKFEALFQKHNEFLNLNHDLKIDVEIFDTREGFCKEVKGCAPYDVYMCGGNDNKLKIINYQNCEQSLSKKKSFEIFEYELSNMLVSFDKRVKGKFNTKLVISYLLGRHCKNDILDLLHLLTRENLRLLVEEDEGIFYQNFTSVLLQVISKYVIKKYSLEKFKEIIFNSSSKIFDVLNISFDDFADDIINYVNSKEFLVAKFLDKEYETLHFLFFYSDVYSDAITLQTLKDFSCRLEEKYEEYKEFFNVDKLEQVFVNVYPTLESFHYDIFNEKTHDWIAGCSSGKTINMVEPRGMKSPNAYKKALGGVCHEFIHYLTFLDGKERPLWLSEGMAIYLGNPRTKEKIIKHSHEIKGECLFGDDFEVFHINGGYLFSQTTVEYIIKKYSMAKLKEILKTPTKSPFDILEINKEDFIQNWKTWVTSDEFII